MQQYYILDYVEQVPFTMQEAFEEIRQHLDHDTFLDLDALETVTIQRVKGTAFILIREEDGLNKE